MDPTVEAYLENLRRQREDVEHRLRDRENKRKESNEIFVGSVKKELEWLEKNKMKYELRNRKFMEEVKDIVEDYKAELAKAYQADQALLVSRRKLDKFIQKNYPKIVSELKSRLFRDHEDVSRKLKAMREGGSELLRLNKDIKDLSEEIQAKRYELLEEEERRLRNEGSLRGHMYSSNPYIKGYDSNVSKPHASTGEYQDISRSKAEGSRSKLSVSPPPHGEGARGTDISENKKYSPQSRDSQFKPSVNERETPQLGGGKMSFGLSENLRSKDSESYHHGRDSDRQRSGSKGTEEDYGGRGGGSGNYGLKIPAKAEGGYGGEKNVQKLNLGKAPGPGGKLADKQNVYYNEQDIEEVEDFDF